MTTQRIYPELTDGREPVVTYSRVPARGSPQGQRAPSTGGDRVEPTLDAVEVPLTDPHDDVDPAFAVVRPEVRADPFDAGMDLSEPQRGPMRFILVGAAVAMLAGVGVLAATVEVATIVPEGMLEKADSIGEPRTEPTGIANLHPWAEPTPAVKSEPTSTAPAVRNIPLTSDQEPPVTEPADKPVAEPGNKANKPAHKGNKEAASAPPTLPVPRAHPEAGPTTSPEPGTATGTASVKTSPALPSAGGPGEPATPKAASASAKATAKPQGTDGLIDRIEDTLAKVDTAPSAPTPSAPAPAGQGLDPSVPVLPPPSHRSSVHNDCLPSDSEFGPCYDVLPPPPVTGNGYPPVLPAPPETVEPSYGAIEPGPVPPEPVPYLYPPPASDEVVVVEEPERRPGVVRRFLARTANAFDRIFSRDRDRDRDRY